MSASGSWIWQRREWPRFRWEAGALADVAARASGARGRLLGAARLLDPDLSREAVARVVFEEALGTSAIEGERLDPAALRSSIARHLGLPTAGLPPTARHEDGLVQVLLDATQRYDAPLTLERLGGWQAALFPTGYSGLRRIRVGELRGPEPMQVVSGALGRERVHYEAPPGRRLDREIRRFLRWFEKPPAGLDGLVRAGLAHVWFVTLHPFEDGNGRLARAITDMALAQDEHQSVRLYSLSRRILEERDTYYEILERTQRGALDVTPWLAWFLEQVAAACEGADRLLGSVLAKARFWIAHAAVELNERQRKALNRLLDAGPGEFEGDLSTRKYAALTRTSRATAQRELADLVSKGCLEPLEARGRSSAYRIAARWWSL